MNCLFLNGAGPLQAGTCVGGLLLQATLFHLLRDFNSSPPIHLHAAQVGKECVIGADGFGIRNQLLLIAEENTKAK